MDTSAHTRADQGNQAGAWPSHAAASQSSPSRATPTQHPFESHAHWHELLAQVGRELAEPLTAALERVTTLTTTGRLDRSGLLALRHEVDQARQVGLRSQQMARLASGGVQRVHEPVDLAALWREVLNDRARDLRGRGIVVSSTLAPAEVRADASMLFGLMHAWVDWLMGTASGKVSFELSTDMNARTTQMHCRCAPRLAHSTQNDRQKPNLNTLSWFMLIQIAHVLNAELARDDGGEQIVLNLHLPL